MFECAGYKIRIGFCQRTGKLGRVEFLVDVNNPADVGSALAHVAIVRELSRSVAKKNRLVWRSRRIQIRLGGTEPGRGLLPSTFSGGLFVFGWFAQATLEREFGFLLLNRANAKSGSKGGLQSDLTGRGRVDA
jgi:hypothetical protein